MITKIWMKKIGTDIENVSPYHVLFLVVAVSYVDFFKAA